MNTRSTKSSTDSESLSEPPIVIYKVGGSLFTLPNLATRIREIIRQRAGSLPLLVAGGGSATDIVRQWDHTRNLGEQRSHGIALRSLQLNDALLAELLPEAVVVQDKEQAVRAWENADLPIAAAREFLQAAEERTDRLPHCWEVTSDSIAAWLALRFKASELVLLKSVGLPPRGTLDTARNQQLVDPYFPQLAHQVRRISWVNLRCPEPRIQAWLT